MHSHSPHFPVLVALAMFAVYQMTAYICPLALGNLYLASREKNSIVHVSSCEAHLSSVHWSMIVSGRSLDCSCLVDERIGCLGLVAIA